MKIDLPDDHPIAEAIRELTMAGTPIQSMWLSLDALGPGGHKRIFSLSVDAWSLTERTEKRFELELIDASARTREIEALLKWPEMPTTDITEIVVDDPSQ